MVLVEVVGDTSRLHRLVICAVTVPGPLALRQLQVVPSYIDAELSGLGFAPTQPLAL